MTRAFPPHQGFGTFQQTGLDTKNRLVMEQEVAVLNSFVHRCLQRQIPFFTPVEVWVVKLPTVFALFLCAVHGNFRMFQQ